MTAALPDPATSRALLVGVHDYESLEDLPAVERNLTGLKRTFTDETLWGLPDAHCVVLPQPASAEVVLDTLHSVALQTTDTLVVYYAGHGLTDPYSDELFLALPSSDQRRIYSALPYEWVRRAVLDPQVRARRKVVILDCCYSGRALLGGMSGTDQVADRARIEGTSVLAASAETRTALSPPGEEFTAFTGELITLLAEGIADGPPLLDMHTLFRHLHSVLAAKSRPLPQQRNRNAGGMIALARNRMRLPPPPEDPAPERHETPPPRPEAPAPASGIPPLPPGKPAAKADVKADAKADVKADAEADERAPDGESPGSADNPRPTSTRAGARFLRRPGIHGSSWFRIGVVSLGVLLVAGVPTLLSWLPDRPDDTGGSSGAAAYNAAAKGVVNASTATGGTLKFAGTEADSWDPQRSYYGFVWNFARFYTRQLVTYAAAPGAKSAELTPDLATSTATISSDGKRYTYTLRAGVSWEDGTPITSMDIKYGIERLWAQDVVSGGPVHLQQALDPNHTYRGPYKDESRDKLGLKAIETPNSRTIVFQLPEPNSEFEQLLAMTAASPVKRTKDKGAEYGRLPFSSGPYRFHTYEPNKKLELVRNRHWKKATDPVRTALPDKIEVTFFSDPDAADLALSQGHFDLALDSRGLGRSVRSTTMEDAGLKKNLDHPFTGSVRYAAFPQSVKPMDNVHCRRAVIYAADHKMLQSALGGSALGDIAPNLFPPGLPGSDATFDPYGVRKNGGGPDLAKARDELRSCGRPDGFATTIAVREVPEEVDAAESLQGSLRKAGIDTRIEKFDRLRAVEITGSPKVVEKNGYGIVIARWGADFPTGQTFWQPLVSSKAIPPSGNVNLPEVRNRTVDVALDAATASPATGPEAASALYEQINHTVTKEAYYLPLVYDRIVTWRSPRLTNVYTSHAYGNYDFASLGIQENNKENSKGNSKGNSEGN
ncbi:oligopeptide-binding protein [Streptomyces sp. NBRC 110611]|uniref:caspase, EACC1-associated type n=1 Tax=Streptomyces sp. NBRC 110611 TaxID=1621259 RepID=UPI0008315D7E|nr:ABC transporter substrate-binding protein [Streptomyces sp. NBRC 110611]GAU67913.1 oligopeptide-binding protein [Streptomyces sp. NBRC 110611]